MIGPSSDRALKKCLLVGPKFGPKACKPRIVGFSDQDYTKMSILTCPKLISKQKKLGRTGSKYSDRIDLIISIKVLLLLKI